jgi:hypothetical protein
MSFENIKTKWYPELREHAPGIPILLAGLGLNEWEGKRNESIVAKAEGEALKEEIKVNSYVDRVFGKCKRHLAACCDIGLQLHRVLRPFPGESQVPF